MHKCRDCGTIALHPEAVLCPSCKEKSMERRREYNRERSRRIYAEKKRGKEPPPKVPHKCATDGCEEIVPPKRTYCAACRKKRDKASRDRWAAKQPPREYKAIVPWYMPQSKSTDMAWMDKFRPYIESGLSYAEYQKREMGY